MTLSLVGDPGNGNVVQHPSGLIVMRAEDFIGPARGTLTTVSDSASVAGTVVEETQDLAVPTTLSGAASSSRWPSASDTLRIPVATLAPYVIGDVDRFMFLVTMKTSGDVPTNARYQTTHSIFGSTAGMAWGRDSTFFDEVAVKTELWGPQYKHTPPVQIFWSQISSGTNLTVRLWGVTGGTLEYLIDMVYLWPYDGQQMRLRFGGTAFPPFDYLINGVVAADEDTDDTDNVIGQFSVGTVANEGIFSTAASTDFQEGGDEPTIYNITDGTWSFQDPPFSLLDPKSWLSFLAAPIYVPQTTLIDEPFAGAAIGTTGVTIVSNPTGYLVTGIPGNFGGPGHPNGTSGWTRDGAGNLRCSIVRSSAVPGGTYGANFPRARADMVLGLDEWDSFTGGGTPGTDPRDYYPTLTDLEDFVMEATFACDVAGEVTALYGFQSYGPDFTLAFNLVANAYGLCVDLAGTTLTAFLRGSMTGFGANDFDVFSSVDTLTSSYSPGDVWRVKVERRRYRLRAKVWEDGTSEPGAWTFDEYMPAHFNNLASSVWGWIQYPYDVNWPGDVDHDQMVQVWFFNQRSWPGISCMPHQTSPDQVVTTQFVKLDIDPAGSTPIDMLVAEENWDGTSRSNDITIPYATIPSPRFVEGSLRQRHFSADTLGYNLLAWKDGGSGPELQSSALPIIFELGKVGDFLPHIYRLVIF